MICDISFEGNENCMQFGEQPRRLFGDDGRERVPRFYERIYDSVPIGRRKAEQ